MKHRVDYDVVRRPTNTTAGRTNIVDKIYKNGAVDRVINLGYIEKTRGAKYYTAYVQSDDDDNHKFVGDDFGTRSRAAHEILRQFDIIHPLKRFGESSN